MKKRRFLALFMAVAMLGIFALTGCSGNNTQQQDSTSAPSAQTAEGDLLAQIRERGDIIVAMEGTWAPWKMCIRDSCWGLVWPHHSVFW